MEDGIIMSLHLKNFFCHDNLQITLNNKHVNFIIGRNGSGKSAILTALVVGLGGRATSTNRGTNIQAFIKKGTNSAHIEIKINNSSPNGYKPNVYGSFITVARTLTLSGGSSYKIKNHLGEVISTKHEEVNSICNHLDIQVDNPICVLNQDESRNFHASDPKKKFAMFRRATNLECMENNLKKCLQTCERAKIILQRKDEASAAIKREIDKLSALNDQLQNAEIMEKKISSLQDEFYWSEVNEIEKNLKTLDKEYIQIKSIIDQTTVKAENLTTLNTDLTNLISNLLKSLKETEGTSEESTNFQLLRNKLKTSKAEWKVTNQLMKRKQEEVRREKEKHDDLEREVAAVIGIDVEEKKKNKLAEVKSLETELTESKARKSTTENDLSQIRSSRGLKQVEMDGEKTKFKSVEGKLHQVKSQLNEINAKASNSLGVYGHCMVELVDAINEAHERGLFSEKPRGPIGAYLKVRDKKWTGPLESIIQGNVRSFCVNTFEDSKKLFIMMQRIYGNAPKPSVTTSKFLNRVHDVSRKAVQCPPGYLSALNCLQIDDAVVANHLIDSTGVECILMVPTQEEAMELSTNPSSVPKNCTKMITLDHSEFYPVPNYRSYGGTAKPSKFLQVSTGDRKIQLQEQVNALINEVESARRDLRIRASEMQTLNNNEQAYTKTYNLLTQNIIKMEGRIVNIKADLDEMEGGHIRVLTEDLTSTKNNLKTLLEEERTLIAKETSLGQHVSGVETVVNLKEKECNKKQLRLNEELSQKKMNLERNKASLKMLELAKNDEIEKLRLSGEKKKDIGTILKTKTQGALQLCPRISNTREPEKVKAEISKIEAKLRSVKMSGLSRQDVTRDLIEKKTQYNTTTSIIRELSHLADLVMGSAQTHAKYRIKLQILISKRVQLCFQAVLTLRGYSGSMTVDSEKKTLDIHCTGRDTNLRTADSTLSLSGGERSYATVAFIMALWDCMELPFYYMDEFDVFMDAVNRRTTLELLLYTAKKKPSIQYVFLTPQDAAIPVGNNIEIHRLEDPLRTLNR